MDTEKWGREKAKSRYGTTGTNSMKSGTSAGKAINVGLIDQPMLEESDRVMQAPQAINDKQGPKYDNEVPSNWLRGMGSGQAEGKPSFDKSKGRR